MGDRSSTRSATRRTTPQPPPKPFTHRSNAPQNPPRRIARSIRSTSRGISDSEASLQDAKRRPKNAGKTIITENAAINRDSSKARKLRGFNQSRVLKDLSTVREDTSILYPELPQDDVDETELITEPSKSITRHVQQEIKSFEGISAISGTTARTSFSAHPSMNLHSKEPASQKTLEETVAKIEDDIDVSVESLQSDRAHKAPIKHLFAAVDSTDISKQGVAIANKILDANVSFNSPKALQGAVSHLKRRKANREASGEFHSGVLSPKSGASRRVHVTRSNPIVHAFTPNHQTDGTVIPSTAPPRLRNDRLQMRDESKHEAAQALMNVVRELTPRTDLVEDWQNQPFEDEEGLFSGGEEAALIRGENIMKAKAQLEAENNKENLAEVAEPAPPSKSLEVPEGFRHGTKKSRFIDPQINAQRVAFDSQDSMQVTQPGTKGQRYPTKDPVDDGDNPDVMDDISSNEGYEQDRRVIDIPSRRTEKSPRKRPAVDPVANQPSLRKKVRSAAKGKSLKDKLRDATAQHKNERNNQENSTPEPSQLEAYKFAKDVAKRNNAVLPKKVQTRKAWTDGETETLIDLIEAHGTSWKLIKEMDKDSILEYRDQVALKDKARNIKFDFLKAGPFLPINFEYVPLNRMQIGKLEDLGIVYNPATGMLRDGDEGEDEE